MVRDRDTGKGEHWEGAVFTNAHNEFLNQMCNVGILGTVSYLAIFLVGMRRYGDDGKENVAGRAAREAEGHGLCGGLGLLACNGELPAGIECTAPVSGAGTV